MVGEGENWGRVYVDLRLLLATLTILLAAPLPSPFLSPLKPSKFSTNPLKQDFLIDSRHHHSHTLPLFSITITKDERRPEREPARGSYH